MLVGARQAGFDVVANVEWRKYYHARDPHGQNTFAANFPGAVFKEKIENLTPQEIERVMNPTLALGHPECGNFSLLAGANKSRLEKLQDAADIPLFVDLVGRIRPRFFVMDDLPKSFGAYPMSEYAAALPDYDLYPEWISNWGYGNIQKWRNRMFMIGSLREERWAFRPGETDDPDKLRTLENTIGDLPEPRAGSNFPNHDPCALDETSGRSLSMRFIGDRPTWREVAEFAEKNWPPGMSVSYHANDGTIKYKPGSKVEYWDSRGASVQCGASYKFHPMRFTPLTLRERARIQGFPDDFVFYGARLNEAGEYNYDKNVHMTKQTGKAMPVQFCRYVSEQVMAAAEGLPFDCSNTRILRPNGDVDAAKQWYCENVGYSDQDRACGSCWLYSTCMIRARKYKIGEPTVGQRDLVDPGMVPIPEAKPRKKKSKLPSPPAAEVASSEQAGATGGGGEERSMARSRRVDRSSTPRRFAAIPSEEEFDLFEEGEE